MFCFLRSGDRVLVSRFVDPTTAGPCFVFEVEVEGAALDRLDGHRIVGNEVAELFMLDALRELTAPVYPDGVVELLAC